MLVFVVLGESMPLDSTGARVFPGVPPVRNPRTPKLPKLGDWMNNNVDIKAENTYTISGKTEDWKLSSRKLNAIARKQGWQDALDKTKMGTLITKSEYDAHKANGAANLTPGQ